MNYDLPTMRRLLDLATQLGYQEEIDHWNAEIKKVVDAS